MRLRKKKNAPARFERCAAYTIPTDGLKDAFYRYFDADMPLSLIHI